MSSLLARFRKRATTHPPQQSTPSSRKSHQTMTPTSRITLAVHNPDPTPRRIHPDVNSLLESYTDEESTMQPSGLRPSTRRNSVDGSGPRDTRAGIISRLIPQEPVPELEETEVPQASGGKFTTRSSSPADGPISKGPLLNRLSQLVSVREWSTFGRNTEHPSPPISDFNDPNTPLPGSKDGPLIRRSSSKRVQHLRRSSSARSNGSNRHSPHHSLPSTQSHGDAPSSPAHTDSSHMTPPHGDAFFRRTPNTSIRSPIVVSQTERRSNRSVRGIESDSPGTFGQPTPPHSKTSTSGISPGSNLKTEIDPPPLPPLDHPAFNASPHSRVVDQLHEDVFMQPTGVGDATELAKQTRKRSKTLDGLPSRAHPHHDQLHDAIKPNFATLPRSFGKYIRSRTNSTPFTPRPRKSSDVDDVASARSAPSRRSSLRRRSADWSSQQAVMGVTESNDVSWPAEVSREMLRLSLGERFVGSEGATPARDWRARMRSSSDGPLTKSGDRQNNVQPRGGDSLSLASNFPNVVRQAHPPLPSSTERIVPLGSPFLLQEKFHQSEQSDDDNHDHFTIAVEEGNHFMGSEEPKPNKASPSSTISRKGIDQNYDSFTNAPSQSSPITIPIPTVTSSDAGPSSPIAPDFSFTAPTPGTSPKRSISDPSSSPLPIPKTSHRRPLSTGSKGKRKAEELEKDTHDTKKEVQKAKITLPPERRVHRASGESSSSQSPSSYAHKRPKVSGSTPAQTPMQSRPGSILRREPGTWSSRTSVDTRASRTPVRSNLYRANSKVTSSRSATEKDRDLRPSESRRSMSISQVSIPISALVSPHAPSIGRSTAYHMRDPRRPKVHDTGWALRIKNEANEEDGSPIHAWLFFVGFAAFPLWWIASFLKVPKTRSVGGSDVEKAVFVDDPQVEHDAKAWRSRCRVMSLVSFLTYIPFIVLVAIFAR